MPSTPGVVRPSTGALARVKGRRRLKIGQIRCTRFQQKWRFHVPLKWGGNSPPDARTHDERAIGLLLMRVVFAVSGKLTLWAEPIADGRDMKATPDDEGLLQISCAQWGRTKITTRFADTRNPRLAALFRATDQR